MSLELKSETEDASKTEPAPKRNAALSFADRLEASPRLYLGVFTAAYFLAMFWKNSIRTLWIDEIFMIYLADLPSIAQIWLTIAKGVELNPPLPFWLTWLIHHSLGSGEVLSRLPSTIGFWLMCVCLFHFVRRRSDAVHGFVALLLPLFTFTSSEATFARGYGLLLGFSAASLLCWQLAADGVRRTWTLLGLAVSAAGALSCHYYAAYVIAAIGLGELVRAKNRRRIDFPVLAMLALGASPLLAYASLIKTAKGGLATFWISPMPGFLYSSYADLIGPVAIVLLLFMAMVVWSPETGRVRLAWMPALLERHEEFVCLLLVAMPIVIFVAAEMGIAAFFQRYIQPVVIGFTIVITMFAYRIGGGDRWFRQALVSALVWLCLMPWFAWQATAYLLHSSKVGSEYLSQINLAIAPELPIVVDSDADFMTDYYYATPVVKKRLFMLADMRGAVKYLGSDTTMRGFEVMQTFRELHVVQYQEFLRTHREFLIVRIRPVSWIIQSLLADGAQLELMEYKKEPGPFVNEALMFKVKVPERFASGTR